MKTTLLACVAALCLIFCFNTAKAQADSTAMQDTIAIDTTQYFDYSAPADSSFYDMGRMRLQKKFTQAITIKAADLQTMPFMDLKEALAVYYGGIYGSTQKFTYVINGLLNADVNAYSIYDIDEITFVQNAGTALNGIVPSQVLVLIKTKRGGPGQEGYYVNAQTNMVRRYVPSIGLTKNNVGNNGPSSSDLYHQFYVSAYTNSSWINAGASASIQHNVFPAYKTPDNYWDIDFKPYTSDRIKLNGYVDVKIDDYNVMSLDAGFVPQQDAEARKRYVTILGTQVETGSRRKEKQTLMYANFNYKSTIIDRINNTFSAGFQRLNLKGNVNAENNINISDTVGTVTNYTIKNDIDYRFELGDLVLTPQLNLTYRNATDTSNTTYYLVLTRIRGYNQTQRLFTVTPSMSVNLKDIFLVQFGAQRALFSKNNFSNNRVIINKEITGPNGVFFPEYKPRQSEFNNSTETPILPFATISVDLLKTAYKLSSRKVRSKPYDGSRTSLMLFGSFARTTSYTTDIYGALSSSVTERPDPVDPIYEAYNAGKAYNQIQGGLTYSLLKKGLSVSYNYSNSKFATVYYVRSAFGNPPDDSANLAVAKIQTHRLSISYTTPANSNFKWTTSLNGAYITNEGPQVNYYTEQMRGFYSKVDSTLFTKGIITGGLVNQFTYKRAYLGFNILYGFNRANYSTQSITSTRYVDYAKNTHVLNLQSVYLGYQLKLFDWIKSLDVFVNARNVLQHYSGSDSYRHYSADDSRFMGGGFKLAL